MILCDLPCLVRVRGKRREANFVKLEPIQGPMKVPARADRFRQHYTGGVNSLIDPQDVASPRNLLNQDGGETFGTELLMDAEKVDFGRFERLGSNARSHGNSGYESNEFARLRSANSDMPFFSPAWGFEGPGRIGQ